VSDQDGSHETNARRYPDQHHGNGASLEDYNEDYYRRSRWKPPPVIQGTVGMARERLQAIEDNGVA
jgi:hypothetical protein